MPRLRALLLKVYDQPPHHRRRPKCLRTTPITRHHLRHPSGEPELRGLLVCVGAATDHQILSLHTEATYFVHLQLWQRRVAGMLHAAAYAWLG